MRPAQHTASLRWHRLGQNRCAHGQDLRLFSFGFRPFFLFAPIEQHGRDGCWAVCPIRALITLPHKVSSVFLAAHEFLFGLSGCGACPVSCWLPFQLGRGSTNGWAGDWRTCSGFSGSRGAPPILFSSGLPVFMAPTLDLAFSADAGYADLREIVAGKETAQPCLLALLGVLPLANAFSISRRWDRARRGHRAMASAGAGQRP